MSTSTRSGEARELRAQLNDLIALVSMPAMWRGRDVAEILSNLADALFSLLRPDLLYIEFDGGRGDPAHAAVRPRIARDSLDVGRELRDRLGSGRPVWRSERLGELRLEEVDPGLRADLQAEDWFVVVGSAGGDEVVTTFQELLVRVAVEQAALAAEMVRLLERAQVASRTKSAFLATVSHELRTPLNAIIGYADLLLEGVPSEIPDPASEQVERIAVSAHHLLELVDQILTYTESEGGREDVVLEAVDVGELTDEVAALVEPLATRKDLALRVDRPDESGRLRTDGQKVRQILVNLLDNAVKYTAEGEVGLEVARREDRIRFVVRDTGPGIPPGRLEEIFEPFERRDSETDDPEAGTGLGLAVARELAHLLGGELEAGSEVGRGSVFTLELPLEPPERLGGPPDPPPAGPEIPGDPGERSGP